MSLFFAISFVAYYLITDYIAASNKSTTNYPKSLASYYDFKNLVSNVENIRSEKLVNYDTFVKMSKENNTVILDTRSQARFRNKHLAGAIHIEFTEFTQENLKNLIPDTNTRILIYCNNNFTGDSINFANKGAGILNNGEQVTNQKSITLALNLPTYINLYGYGYKNIYELDELLNIKDERVKFEGLEVN